VQVVLPLLQNEVVATGWVSQADFLTGLALVQAMPGPLFNFAAYLGARLLFPSVIPPRGLLVQGSCTLQTLDTCLPDIRLLQRPEVW
jgi:chromate transport protein ChrA